MTITKLDKRRKKYPWRKYCPPMWIAAWACAFGLPLPAASVQCCITSPPYWGLRDYCVPGQLGLEDTPEAHLEILVAVFREVKRVLKDDGTLWMNYGDTYLRQQGSGFNSNKYRLNEANRSIKPKRPIPAKNLLGTRKMTF